MTSDLNERCTEPPVFTYPDYVETAEEKRSYNMAMDRKFKCIPPITKYIWLRAIGALFMAKLVGRCSICWLWFRPSLAIRDISPTDHPQEIHSCEACHKVLKNLYREDYEEAKK